jgi:hypothetical protein
MTGGERKSAEAPMAPISERQLALIAAIQKLNPDARHTLKIECRGTEPWKISAMVEHLDVELRPRKEK